MFRLKHAGQPDLQGSSRHRAPYFLRFHHGIAAGFQRSGQTRDRIGSTLSFFQAWWEVSSWAAGRRDFVEPHHLEHVQNASNRQTKTHGLPHVAMTLGLLS